MNRFLKNVCNAALLVAVSGGVASGVTAFIMKGKEGKSNVYGDDGVAFRQPLQMASYNGSAAENTDFTYAAEKTIHAVVHIKVASTVVEQNYNPFEFLFGIEDPRSGKQRKRMGSGSGVIISNDGYIITNNHVIEGADEINVTLNDKRSFTGKVIGADPSTDIALIKIDATDLQPIAFGDSEKLKIGEWVLAVGNPFDLTSTVTAGIVSAKGRAFMAGDNNRDKITSFIQTDAVVNPGNSGGALVNTRGELVGINTAIVSHTGDFSGHSFAVPISIAGKVVNDLKTYGVVQRALLGISIDDPENAQKRDDKVKTLQGAYVVDFSMRSSAKEAGLEIGDVITAVNGVKVTSPNSLQEQIMKYQPSDKVKITVDRYGVEKEFTVELRNVQGNTEIVKGNDGASLLGATFRPLSDKTKRAYGIGYGVEVYDVIKGRIKDCGIRKGFIIMIVNEQRIQTPEDLFSVVDKVYKSSASDKVLIVKGFYPNGQTRHYAIDLVD